MSFLSKLISKLIEIFSGYGEPIAEVEMVIRPWDLIEYPQNQYRCSVIYKDKLHLYALTALYTAKITWLFLKDRKFYLRFLNAALPKFIDNNFEWITNEGESTPNTSDISSNYYSINMLSNYYRISSDIYKKDIELMESDPSHLREWNSIGYWEMNWKPPEEMVFEIKLYKTENGFTTFNSWSPKLISPKEVLTHYFLFLKEIYNRLNDEEQKIFKKLLISLHNGLQRSLDSSLSGLQRSREMANTLLLQFERLIREAGRRIKEEQSPTRTILEKDNQKLNLVKCSRCGEENQLTNNFCTNCGQKLKK